MAGLDRLRERGHFLQPESGQGDVELLHDAASPVSAFVRDCCRLDPTFQVPKDDLYRAYLRYMTEAGHTGRPAKSTFARDLLAAVAGVEGKRAGTNGERQQVFTGIDLTEEGRRLSEFVL